MTPGEKKAYATHETRIAMGASTYDEICTRCGATDGLGTWGNLVKPCPKETCEHRKARVVTCICPDDGLGAHNDCPIHGTISFPPDPRDAEIARLKAAIETLQVEHVDLYRTEAQLRRALAAGPAALREVTAGYSDYDLAASRVESAQEAALKEGVVGDDESR